MIKNKSKAKETNTKPLLPDLIEVIRGIEIGGLRFEPGSVVRPDDLDNFPLPVVLTWLKRGVLKEIKDNGLSR